MKKVFAILMSVLMAFLLGCEKDALLLPQEDEALTPDFRADLPTEPQTPAWKMVISQMDDYIMQAVDENVLDANLGKVLMAQSDLIEKLIGKDAVPAAREQIQVFKGKVETMVEKGYFPIIRARPLMGMADKLTLILEGKLVQFREGFENYETGAFPYEGGWDLHFNGMGEGFQYISDGVAYSGTKSLKLEGRIGWPAVAFKPMPELSRVVFAEAKVYIHKPQSGVLDSHKAGFGLGTLEKGYLGKDVHHAFVYFKTNGNIYFGATGVKAEKIGAWQGNKWYDIRIRYDAAFKTGSVWVDGELRLENVNLKGPQGTYAGVLLDSGRDTHTFTFFDDVMAWKPVE